MNRNKPDILPKIFLYRLQEIVPPPNINSVLSSFTQKRLTTIRVNTLKTTPRELRNDFFEMGIKLENVIWYKDAFIVKNRTLRELTALREYLEGYFYVQSLSSMFPPLLLAPKPNEKVLDITAAPGSKTTQMAQLMGNTGQIIANDSSRIRLYKLEANLRTQGVTNVHTVNMPAEALWKAYPEYFDKVLADVPCSMEGRFATYDYDTYKGWSVKKVKNLARLQQWILRSAVSSAKVGARIVYSTCTISPEENEGVIDWILEKEEGNVRLENIEHGTWNMELGITEWEGRKYNPQVGRTARILPSSTMEGFFIAILRKMKSNVSFVMEKQ